MIGRAQRRVLLELFPATIVIPRRRFPLVERAYFENIMENVAASRVTLVVAPAGSGKTSAASYWLQQSATSGRPGLWLACRAGLRDFRTFIMALKEAGIREGLPWSDLNASGSASDCLPLLSNYSERRPVIVVDDAHLLDTETLDFLERWIVGARDAITIIIVTRREIQIPVSRMRSLGFLVEVGLADLAFDNSEATKLIATMVETPDDVAAALSLTSDMEGWAAGLIIAAEDYRKNRDMVAHALAIDENLNSYFQEEVLGKQDARMREFLIGTSVLEKLTFASCAAVMSNDNAGILLERAYKEGLFLSKSLEERDTYRYNARYRSIILASAVNLSATNVAIYERRASEYYATIGEAHLAIDHALRANDQNFLADQLDKLAHDMINSGDLYRLDDIAATLPWSVISKRPMLLLALAWRKTRRLSLAAAERCIVTAEEIAKSRPDDHVWPMFFGIAAFCWKGRETT